jgi:hypothetical protein
MRRKIELSAEAIKEIDAARGNVSRSEYVDRLLQKYQGVLLPHTPDTDCPKSRKKLKQK